MTDANVFSIVGQNLKLNTKADIQPHLDKLEQIADLEEIHLGGNTLGVEACQALADVLKQKKSLKVADFADIFTGRLISEIPDALRALCDALTDHENLVEINLSDNAFGGRSAEPMVNFLKHNHHFSVLKLNNNGLGVTGGTIVAEALIEAAKELESKGLKSNLRTVICGRNRLENGSAPVWAKAFAAHGGLVEVRMFQNGIRMEGIEAISQGLSACPNLEVLDLQDNTATLRGSRAIAACLPKWPVLKTLNLSDCLLKPKGGALVFGALAKGTNTQLETLQVQYCDLDRKALETLGDAISQHLKQLTKLEINGNWADEEDECITKIKEALAKYDHEDALDELDEMDPEGEEDEEEAEEEEEEEEEGKAEEEKKVEEATAAAPVAAAAAAAAAAAPVAAGAAVAAKKDETDQLAEKLEKTQVAEETAPQATKEVEAPKETQAEALKVESTPAPEATPVVAATETQAAEPVTAGQTEVVPAASAPAEEPSVPAAAAAAAPTAPTAPTAPAASEPVAAPAEETAAPVAAPAVAEATPVAAPAEETAAAAAAPAPPADATASDAPATTSEPAAPATEAAAPTAAAEAPASSSAPETPAKKKGLKGLIASLKQAFK